jgi:hypothetical protein
MPDPSLRSGVRAAAGGKLDLLCDLIAFSIIIVARCRAAEPVRDSSLLALGEPHSARQTMNAQGCSRRAIAGGACRGRGRCRTRKRPVKSRLLDGWRRWFTAGAP